MGVEHRIREFWEWFKSRYQRPASYVGLPYKYGLFTVNVIFWILSISLIAVGAYVLNVKSKPVREALDFFIDPAIWITFIGSIMFVISFLGMWGALRENAYFLNAYIWILRILFAIQMISGILMFVIYYLPAVRTKLNLNPQVIIQKAIIKYRDDEDLKDIVDGIQSRLHCCGIGSINSEAPAGYKDWSLNVYFNCTKKNPSFERCAVPASCCRVTKNRLLNRQCGFKAQEMSIEAADIIYTTGCVHRISLWISAHAMVAGVIALVIIIPQIYLCYMAQTLDDQIYQQKFWPPLDKVAVDPTATQFMPDGTMNIVRKYHRATTFARSGGRDVEASMSGSLEAMPTIVPEISESHVPLPSISVVDQPPTKRRKKAADTDGETSEKKYKKRRKVKSKQSLASNNTQGS